eukprot:scaffold6407_cov78-Cyclotella_meneghiniana.AAC.5
MEMRQLGDAYVKSEFRLHKSTTKPELLEQFFTEWDKYLLHIEQTGRKQQSRDTGLVDAPPSHSSTSMIGDNSNNKVGFGRDVSSAVFNEEQEAQLQKLREEAEKAAAGK